MEPNPKFNRNNLKITDMLSQLDELFKQEEVLKRDLMIKYNQLEQLKDDITLLEEVIMHQSNKKSRGRGVNR